ncbi:hypothetical protein [Bremerella cremea]|uniref:hypothetical protein n=1 Tax=Bremerella cremea TaxID=1031537 RepID=UPI0011C0489D|nr:hypothetical protein [Bremerella cremea]
MIRSLALLTVLTLGLAMASTAEAGWGCGPGYGGYGPGYGYAPYNSYPVRASYYRGYYGPRVNTSPFYNTYPPLYYGGYRGYGIGGGMGYGRYGYGPSFGVGF